MTCTSCTAPADQYLCPACIRDLQAWIDRVPALREELFTTMAKLDKVAAPRGEGGGGMSTGSAMPLRERAMDMRQALLLWEGHDARELANDPHASGYLPMLERLFKKADEIMDLPIELFIFGACESPTEYGPCEELITAEPDAKVATCPACDATLQLADRAEELKKKARGNPMPPREAREYLQREVHAYITKKDFENWVQLRKLPYVLERVTIEERPKRIYFPGDVLNVYQEMKNRRRIP